MKKTLLLLSFLILIIYNLKAKIAEKGIIRGKVVEEVGGLSIPSAVISLYVGDSEQILTTTASNEDGFFSFKNLKSGIYRVKVSFVSYVAVNVADIVVTESDYDRNVGTVKLVSDQTTLQDVNITVQKPAVEFGADGITYNVSSSILAEGSTATDVLKNVPMVQVDIDGNATIAGKKTTRIFIDGKPSDYMTSNIADLLNVLPSDAIDKIEVLTNPPVKYSGDGEGIINIVMKKGFKVGFNGNLGITSSVRGNSNANGNASYKGSNYSVSGSGAYRYNVGKYAGESYRENFFADTTFYYDQAAASKNIGTGMNARVGLDWDITKQQNLRLSSSYNTNGADGNSTNELHYLSESLQESRLRNQLNLNEGKSKNFVFNADYNFNLDTAGSKLSLGLTINGNNNQDQRQYNTSYIATTTLKPGLQENENNTSNKGVNFNLDYDKSLFKKRDRFEAGLAYIYRKNDNDLFVQNFDFTKQIFNVNNKLTNQFFYNENILASYVSYNYRKNGVSLKGGLRAEQTNVDFDLSTGENYNVKPYLSVFPNLSISKFFRKRYTLGATYSIRINRPRETFLNPQVNNVDTLNISYGNPNLSPAYTHQMDVSFGVFGEKWSFTPRLAYSTSQGVIERFRTVTLIPGAKSARSETTFDNVGTNHAISLILIGNYRPTKTISTNANFSVIRSDYTSKLNSSLNRNGLSIRGALGFSMQLPQRTAVEANFNYANLTNAQGTYKGSLTTSIAARRVFFKNKLNVRVSANDIFGNGTATSLNEGINFRLNSSSSRNTQNVSLSLNYRFTKIKKISNVKIPPAPTAP